MPGVDKGARGTRTSMWKEGQVESSSKRLDKMKVEEQEAQEVTRIHDRKGGGESMGWPGEALEGGREVQWRMGWIVEMSLVTQPSSNH